MTDIFGDNFPEEAGMKITIEASAKEIASFVLELQNRRTMQNLPEKIELCFNEKKVMESVLGAIRGMREAN